DLNQDLPKICQHDMDFWLAVISSYGMLARYKENVYICAHGNDFLSPWVTYEMPWLQLRGVWRLKQPLEKALLGWVRKKYLRRVAGVFPNSEYTKERFISKFPELADKVSVINHGVDPNFFQQHESRKNGEFHLLTVARLTNARKNIDSVIKSLAELKKDYSFRYTVIGDGPMRPALEQLVADLGLADRVQIMGRVTYEELREAYRTADLFVLAPWTSDKDVEGFGMVYLEANASGVPVLASRGNGSSSAIAEGISGIFVDDPTADQCRAAIQKVLDGTICFDSQKVVDHAEPFRWSRIAECFLKHMGVAT
ncbi:MAG: glycosyltransferase, partial [Candidatus Omnitrophica bacterium]|nr:glycosyltransferase [Candidatus Omnitrophota bacterium]